MMETKDKNRGKEEELLNQKELLSDEQLQEVESGGWTPVGGRKRPCKECVKYLSLVLKFKCLSDCEGPYSDE